MPETSRAQALSVALDGFSALLSGIYDAAIDPSLWASCLLAICRELRANYVSLIVRPIVMAGLAKLAELVKK